MEHEITWEAVSPKKIMVTCSCGEKWSHPIDVTFDKMNDIFKAHVKYYTRVKQETL